MRLRRLLHLRHLLPCPAAAHRAHASRCLGRVPWRGQVQDRGALHAAGREGGGVLLLQERRAPRSPHALANPDPNPNPNRSPDPAAHIPAAQIPAALHMLRSLHMSRSLHMAGLCPGGALCSPSPLPPPTSLRCTSQQEDDYDDEAETTDGVDNIDYADDEEDDDEDVGSEDRKAKLEVPHAPA